MSATDGAVGCSSCANEDETGSAGTGGGGVVGVGTSGGSLADRGFAVGWIDDEGRLSSRTGGAGGSRWEGAGLL